MFHEKVGQCFIKSRTLFHEKVGQCFIKSKTKNTNATTATNLDSVALSFNHTLSN